jgi:hypothetical protein
MIIQIQKTFLTDVFIKTPRVHFLVTEATNVAEAAGSTAARISLVYFSLQVLTEAVLLRSHSCKLNSLHLSQSLNLRSSTH